MFVGQINVRIKEPNPAVKRANNSHITRHDERCMIFLCEIKPRIMPTNRQTSKCVVVKKQQYCYNVDILWVGTAINCWIIQEMARRWRLLTLLTVLCVATQLCARFSITKESPAFRVGSYGSVARKATNTCFLRGAAGRRKGARGPDLARGPDFGHVCCNMYIQTNVSTQR